MKTYQPKAKEITRQWHQFDASAEVLGRLSSRIAVLLMGKHKPTYSQHMDSGDYVVVKNVEKIQLTGKKNQDKTYKKHSGYPGGFKEVKLEKLRKERPEEIIFKAVRGMLPDNRLRDKRLKRLKLVVGEKNPYQNKFENKS